MACLQLWFVPDTPLRQALRKASLDRKTNVVYSRVSLRDEHTHVKAVSLHAVKCVGTGLLFQCVKRSLPDIDHPDQLFGHEPQCECIEQKGEHTEHHLRVELGLIRLD